MLIEELETVVDMGQVRPAAAQQLFLGHQALVMQVQVGLAVYGGADTGGLIGVELVIDQCFDILCCNPCFAHLAALLLYLLGFSQALPS